MSVTFRAAKFVNNTYELVDGDNEYVNLSYSNAFAVLSELGLTQAYCGSVEVEVAKNLCVTWLRKNLGRLSRPSQTAHDGNIIYCGKPEGYYNKRIHELAVLAGEAKRKGASHISWA